MTTQSADHLYSKSNPYSSGLLVNRVMTEGSDKETRHFEFSLQDSGLSYEPGDSLGVLPVNCSEVVDDLLSVLGFSGTEPVQIGEESFSLKDTLLHKFACTVLSKIQIKKFNDIARVPALEELLKIENKNDLVDYMWGRELIDLFKEYPQQGLAVEDFVSLLRPMPPRLYSIASSLSAHSEEVHLTVAVVRYDSHGRKRKGVCSSYLAERVGETIPCYFHPNKNFKLPG
jgi:sulfite reductase (NADPH) flavoprotein alpha-component